MSFFYSTCLLKMIQKCSYNEKIFNFKNVISNFHPQCGSHTQVVIYTHSGVIYFDTYECDYETRSSVITRHARV
jgi:hypothetical protein